MIYISRLPDLVLRMIGGLMICDFMSFITLFLSYQVDGRVIMKVCVLWKPFTTEKIGPRAGLELGTLIMILQD